MHFLCQIRSLSLHCISYYRPIGLLGWVFADGPGVWGSIPDGLIPNTRKMISDISLFHSQHYNKVRIKDKLEWSEERSRTLPNSSSISYWKVSLRVAFKYGRQLLLLLYPHYLYLFTPREFFKSALIDSLLIEFEGQSPQVSSTLPSILAILNNVVGVMVSTHSLIPVLPSL